MAKSRASSTVLVIDCGIAHAAGPEDAVHPTAKHCRDFLLAVRRICHRIGMSPAVAEEWKRHRSGFARQWLVSMHARKKVVAIDADDDSHLREALEAAATSEKSREAMQKDAHLLEAATQSDQRIVSLDDTVRRLFVKVARKHQAIRPICWVNPDRDFDGVLEWLETGAPADQSRQLGASHYGTEV
ncbi:MAG: hypothetical protein ACKV2Q_04305 [Planctomycetaceae bacterium]